jgi:hypothetical protein
LFFDFRTRKKLTLLVGSIYSGTCGNKCGEKCKTGRCACFNHTDDDGFITANGQGCEPVKVQKDQWYTIVEAARKKTGEDTPEYQCLAHIYNVCLVPLFTQFSIDLWNLYNSVNGMKNESFASYKELPAIWVEACAVINSEVARIDAQRKKSDEQKQAQWLRNMRSGKR